MRSLVLSGLFLLSFGCEAYGQWDYNQHVIDNIIESRIDRRKTQKRIQARKRGTSSAANTDKKTVSAKPAAKKPDPLPRLALEIHRDTFQQFHLGEGYTVNFTFTPLANSAKIITKTFKYDLIEGAAEFKDLPEGVYKVTAEAEYGGKKYKVYIATESSTFENQTGGNYSPSQTFEIKQMTDYWGSKVIGSDPREIYIRVIE